MSNGIILVGRLGSGIIYSGESYVIKPGNHLIKVDSIENSELLGIDYALPYEQVTVKVLGFEMKLF
jgi:translation elongation factor EF-1alpha